MTAQSTYGGNVMCDLAYVNLLREKVRQQEAEERRVAANGATLHRRFVRWSMPLPLQAHNESERARSYRGR
jgi:hypothetical protein